MSEDLAAVKLTLTLKEAVALGPGKTQSALDYPTECENANHLVPRASSVSGLEETSPSSTTTIWKNVTLNFKGTSHLAKDNPLRSSSQVSNHSLLF